MKKTFIIFKKELKTYFNSAIAYIFTAVFLIFSNWIFFQRFFLNNQATVRPFFTFLPWIFLFLIPALSMRLWSEEKRNQTIELLFTLPLRDIEVVLGKYLASLCFFAFSLILTLPLVFTATKLGHLDNGQVIGGYLGSFLLGASFLALGLFISALTQNQIISFLISGVFCFVLFIFGQDYILAPFSGSIAQVINFIGLSSHFYNLVKGLINLKDIVYFLSFIWFCLFLNVKVLESRFYKG